MRDPVLMAARDPSCLMCLTPNDGGGWFSPLRPGVVWPSSMPRNFTAEPETWTEWYRKSAEIGDHNYTRELIVRINDTDGIIWGDSAWQSVFYAMRSGQSVLVCMQPGTANYARVTIPSVAAGIHTITWRKTGNSASYSFDGSELFSAPAVTGNTQWTTRAIPRSTTGTILSDTLRDETLNKIVWNYPNEAERLRLITKTNVRTDRGFFEAADTSIVTRQIKTLLDMRNNTTDKTFLCRATIPEFIYPASGPISNFYFIRQGDFNTQGSRVFGFGAAYTSSGALQMRFRTGDVSAFTNADISDLIGVESIYVAVVSFKLKTLSLYANGVLRVSYTIPAGSWGSGSTSADENVIVFGSNGGYGGIFTMGETFIFNRALSAPEITYLSK